MLEKEGAGREETEMSDKITGVVPADYPPPHNRYLLKRGDVMVTATPCYGIHEPWWVVRTLVGEAAPEPMRDGDVWFTEVDGLRAQLGELEKDLDATIRQRDDFARETVELEEKLAERDAILAECVNSLIAVVPMAKGYAYNSPVGNNLQMVRDAETLIDRLPATAKANAKIIAAAEEHETNPHPYHANGAYLCAVCQAVREKKEMKP
jgi:hypothetical protein